MSSIFKDMLAADRGVFLNLDEFADMHTVEGNRIPAVVDAETFGESKKGEDIGLAAYDLVLYAREEDLPSKRPSGESLNVNGRECTIVSWESAAGMATVYLSHQIGG